MDVANNLRQLVAPGKDQPGKFEEARRVGQRLRQIERRGQRLVEIAAVIVGLPEWPDDRENGRAAAEQIDEFRSQDACRTPRRQVDRHFRQR